MSGFAIDLSPLPRGASQVHLEAAPEDLGLEARSWTGPVVGDVLVEKNGDRVSVRGTVEAVAKVDCVRCLREVQLPIEVPLEVFAERTGTATWAEEDELDRNDYMRFHDGRELDLRGDARDALLLEMPIAPHCREECAGLCPRCGADLNEGSCACAAR